MIEVGNNPGRLDSVIVHSTESDQFLGCTRVEFERLAAAIKRGDLDAFPGMREKSAVADGDADWTRAGFGVGGRETAEEEGGGKR